MKTPKEIKDFLNNKVLANINFTAKEIVSGNTPKVETISIDDFLEWFENKPKEENQDIITFEGKEYEFIECDYLSCCDNCDLAEDGYCTLSPRICRSDNRRDRREGYFKLIKPKNLELIRYEFYYLKRDNYSWVIQFKGFVENERDSISYYYMLKIHDNSLNYNCSCDNNGWTKATPAQKQLLIDKVAEEKDKILNEKTKMFEDKRKDILVPECIKIGRYNGKLLSLFFNENKQYLMFSLNQQTYIVQSADGYEKAFKCKLVAIRFEDLKDGDLFYDNSIESQQRLVDIRNYKIKIKNTDTISISSNNGIILDSCHNMQNRVYKVIPIK